MGIPSQRAGEAYPGERRDVRGVVQFGPRSCLHLVVDGESHFVIWPPGSAPWELVLPNGQRVRQGEAVAGRGAFTPTQPLRGAAGATTYWGQVFSICEVDADEVLVLDSAELAT
jgi:hypothetical protein